MGNVKPVLLLDAVGLTPALLEHAPRLKRLAEEGFSAPVDPVLPAVTCTAQATMTTGLPPSGHGIVGNGWSFRDQGEVWLWRQSDRLVQGEKVWETARARHDGFTYAHLFWWYAMGVDADWVVTPRPAYPADGRKLPDVYTRPPELHGRLAREHGQFPLFRFWGPGADLVSSRWIAEAAATIMEGDEPDLLSVYLPHLDYPLQKVGPDHPSIPDEVAALDAVAAPLIDAALEARRRVIVVSEYGITAVSGPVHINRALRQAGLLEVHANVTGEHLDPLASRAFAVADHQVAHVYCVDEEARDAAREVVSSLDGVDVVLEGETLAAEGLDHPRSGELVCVAAADRWFTYYYWLDDGAAPDYARTVDIHRKPGYDPVELFLDPKKPGLKARLLAKIAARKMGFRNLLNVIPLDATLVKGSHGRRPSSDATGPLVIGSDASFGRERFAQTEIRDLVLGALGLNGS
ncbi:MAG: alkaline phosphatase family protein [Planctomycetota bacterium]